MNIIKNTLRKAIYFIPGTKIFWQTLNGIFIEKPDFIGWGMVTHTFTPWFEGGGDEISKKFIQANSNITKDVLNGKFNLFQFKEENNQKDILDSLMWRHYFVYWTAWYASKTTECTIKNLVECGVCDGLTSYFAMHAIKGKYKFKTYLYDSWDAMKPEYLLDSEKSFTGNYSYLSVENTQKNLIEFKESILFNKGYIPDSFKNSINPSEVVWLHIDLNAALPTLHSLEYFFEKLCTGGVILFDDYAWHEQLDTKKVVDKFFSEKSGVLLPLPTGQAIYFKI